MEVIPVIDVRLGRAVRAVAGDRASYEPLASPLGGGSDPSALARAYRALYPFRTLYVADLDGIEGRGPAATLAESVAAAWDGDAVWLDDGSIKHSDGGARSVRSPIPVTGSECLGETWRAEPLPSRAILSLDFRGDGFLGPPALLADPVLWPRRVIVMTLARVGAGRGPDLVRVAEIARRAGPARSLYAAGGVRDIGDCRALAGVGAQGVLVASALHAGKIKAGDLEEIAGF